MLYLALKRAFVIYITEVGKHSIDQIYIKLVSLLTTGLSLVCTSLTPQDKEGILPVATLSIALQVLRRSRSSSDVAPEVAILLSALKTSINSFNFQEPQSQHRHQIYCNRMKFPVLGHAKSQSSLKFFLNKHIKSP